MAKLWPCPREFQAIVPGEMHAVLYDIKTKSRPPQPFLGKTKNNYKNNNFIHLPFAEDCFIKAKEKPKGGGVLTNKMWDVMNRALSAPIKTSYDFENAIKKYNKDIGTFLLLHRYFGNQSSDFFCYLPKIIKLAQKLPNLIKVGVPLLRQKSFNLNQNIEQCISFSQEQISSLFATAFLCAFPTRNYSDRYPDINFNRLFELDTPQAEQKFLCILNYLKRVCHQTPGGVVTFIRRSMHDFPEWAKKEDYLLNSKVFARDDGNIEDNGRNFLRVDFANKYVGGGVLGRGCVQEEIQFLIYPELMISRLFTEYLEANEALFVIGAERFNNYDGYGTSFKFTGNCNDESYFDNNNRRHSFLVAIDATNFLQPSQQYEKHWIVRELNKAYVGFYHKEKLPLPVATGNWGCGAFGGDKYLKTLIQLMACAIMKRDLYYFTFGDRSQVQEINDILQFFKENCINVARLFEYLVNYKNQTCSENLFQFIKKIHFQQRYPQQSSESKKKKLEQGVKQSDDRFVSTYMNDFKYSNKTSNENKINNNSSKSYENPIEDPVPHYESSCLRPNPIGMPDSARNYFVNKNTDPQTSCPGRARRIIQNYEGIQMQNSNNLLQHANQTQINQMPPAENSENRPRTYNFRRTDL